MMTTVYDNMREEIFFIVLENALDALLLCHENGDPYACDFFSVSVLYDVGDHLEMGEPYDDDGNRHVFIKGGSYEHIKLYRDMLFRF